MELKRETSKISLKEKIKEEYEDLRSYLHILTRKKPILPPYSVEMSGKLIDFEGSSGFIEKEIYPVNEPYVFVSILYNEEKNEYQYQVVEPELSVFERMVLETVYENILDTLTVYESSSQTKEEIIETKTLELIDSYSMEIDTKAIYKILYYIKRDYIGYERLDALMKDPQIEDISCDGSGVPIFVYHRKYHNLKTNISFEGQTA